MAFNSGNNGISPILVAIIGLIGVSSGVAPTRIHAEESFEERLQKAIAAQAEKNANAESEYKQKAETFAAKRESIRQRDMGERRQQELEYEQQLVSRKEKQDSMWRDLIGKLEANETEARAMVAKTTGKMAAEHDESAVDFKNKRAAFSQALKEKIAAELAKAEAERERKREMAKAALVAYFTGGAGLPALAAAGGGQNGGGSGGAISATLPVVKNQAAPATNVKPVPTRSQPTVASAPSAVPPQVARSEQTPSTSARILHCLGHVGVGLALSPPHPLWKAGAAFGAAALSEDCRSLSGDMMGAIVNGSQKFLNAPPDPKAPPRRLRGWRKDGID